MRIVGPATCVALAPASGGSSTAAMKSSRRRPSDVHTLAATGSPRAEHPASNPSSAAPRMRGRSSSIAPLVVLTVLAHSEGVVGKGRVADLPERLRHARPHDRLGRSPRVPAAGRGPLRTHLRSHTKRALATAAVDSRSGRRAGAYRHAARAIGNRAMRHSVSESPGYSWVGSAGGVRGPRGVADWSVVASRRRIEPCVRFSRTRLSDIVHRLAYASVGFTVPFRR
jgi:hypothetical protein